MINSIK